MLPSLHPLIARPRRSRRTMPIASEARELCEPFELHPIFYIRHISLFYTAVSHNLQHKPHHTSPYPPSSTSILIPTVLTVPKPHSTTLFPPYSPLSSRSLTTSPYSTPLHLHTAIASPLRTSPAPRSWRTCTHAQHSTPDLRLLSTPFGARRARSPERAAVDTLRTRTLPASAVARACSDRRDAVRRRRVLRRRRCNSSGVYRRPGGATDATPATRTPVLISLRPPRPGPCRSSHN